MGAISADLIWAYAKYTISRLERDSDDDERSAGYGPQKSVVR